MRTSLLIKRSPTSSRFPIIHYSPSNASCNFKRDGRKRMSLGEEKIWNNNIRKESRRKPPPIVKLSIRGEGNRSHGVGFYKQRGYRAIIELGNLCRDPTNPGEKRSILFPLHIAGSSIQFPSARRQLAQPTVLIVS